MVINMVGQQKESMIGNAWLQPCKPLHQLTRILGRKSTASHYLLSMSTFLGVILLPEGSPFGQVIGPPNWNVFSAQARDSILLWSFIATLTFLPLEK